MKGHEIAFKIVFCFPYVFHWIISQSVQCTMKCIPPIFLTFPAGFLIPIFFSNMNSNCSNLLDTSNLQEQVKKSILLPKVVLTFHCVKKMF